MYPNRFNRYRVTTPRALSVFVIEPLYIDVLLRRSFSPQLRSRRASVLHRMCSRAARPHPPPPRHQTPTASPQLFFSSPSALEYLAMTPSLSTSPSSPIKFGTSGWRGLIADDFTFANVRLALNAIAGHVNDFKKNSTILVGYDTRFYSEEFSQLAVDILHQHHIRTLLCETFTPTPAIAYEIMRRKLDGAINFTASHNPAQYHGLKFSSADAGPALPEVTKDIEARAAKLAEKDGSLPKPVHHESAKT